MTWNEVKESKNKWDEGKWCESEMKWSKFEMNTTSEMKWNKFKIKWNEMKQIWNEVWNDVKRSEQWPRRFRIDLVFDGWMAYRLFLCGGKCFSGDQKTPLQHKREKTRKIHPLFSRLRSSVMSGLKLKSFVKLFAFSVSSFHLFSIFLSVGSSDPTIKSLPPDSWPRNPCMPGPLPL